MTEVLNRDVLVRSVQEIRRLRGELEALKRPAQEPIAVVGVGCRMPGGADPDRFWRFLCEGGNAIRDFPAERGAIDDLLDPTGRTPGTAYTAKAGYLEGVDRFDAAFFGVSPREAAFLDPQQRLLLEVTWEALEDAGQVTDRLSGTATGVYLGIANHDYTQAMIQQLAPEDLEAYWVTSNASTFGAGRLSYVLGLNGPSLSVDASCASSLVAVHLAVQSLRSGECDMALAGGVNVILVPEIYVALSKSRALAPDGVCKTFDKAANGYVRGEGCGIIVLRRLSDAQARGDRILGLIRGSAVTQDGRSSGMTVPNPRAQQEALRGALRSAGLHPSSIGYIEAHGTGTPLGDPIEMRALTAVMGDRRNAGPLRVGSVKTNIGHLEPAAGIAGLIKALLCVRHGEIPPHLNLTELNPELALDPLSVEIPTGLTPWPSNGQPRIAGVSSFGASGTNAHVILEQAPATPQREGTADRAAQLLTLSARTPAALKELAERHRERLVAADPAELADICYTASTGRSHLPIRMAVTASTPAEMRDRLAQQDVLIGQTAAGPRPKAVFLFTGQGSQYPEMARSLAGSEPLVRQILDTADAVLTPLLGQPLPALMSDEQLLDDTRYTQPCLVAVEYALARLWMSWGVEPAALLGHSVGELAAASVAGVMPFEEALRLAALRGRLMHELSENGSMTAVFAGVEQVATLLKPLADRVAVAAVNGPESIVLSGDSDALAELTASLAERGIRTKSLPSSRAFHSPLMDPVLNAFEAAASEIEYSAPRIPVISNRTGQPTKEYTARYWREHIRQPVLFHEGMSALFDQGHRFFVEVGPAPTLLSLARRFAPPGEVTFLPSLRRGHDERDVLLESLGKLYVAGFGIDWDTVYAARPRRRVSLPTYPFQRTRHWFVPSRGRTPAPVPAGLLGRRLTQSGDEVRYATRLDPTQHECLRECVMDGLPVVNIGVYLESAFAATRDRHGDGPMVASGTAVLQGLVLADPSTPVEAELHLDAQGGYRFYAEHPGQGQVLHARGTVRRDGSLVAAADGLAHLESHRQAMPSTMSGEEFHRALELQRNLHIGPSARWIESVWRDGGEAVARMRAARPGEAQRYLLHPGLTDAMFQLLFACLPDHADPSLTYALVGIDRFEFYGVPEKEVLYCQALLHPSSDPDGTLSAEVRLTDSAGRMVAHASGVAARPASRSSMLRRREPATAKPTQAPPSAVSPREAVLDAVAQALRADRGGLDPAESLQNLGLDSLMALEVRDSLSALYGIQLPLVAFLEGSSVSSLGDLVASLLDPAVALPVTASVGTPAAKSVGIVHDAAGRHEPFGLTDLQQAYLVGRSGALPLGNISTYFYLEVDLEDIDLTRLTDAWNHMIQRHDMLRAVVTPDGQQRVLAEVPRYEIAVSDLRDLPEAERDSRLEQRHEEMKNQVFDASAWPLFDIRASRLDDSWTRLHVGADALTMDAWSTGLVFAEWSQVYHGHAGSLADLTITFRDYLLAARALEESAEYEKSLAYWRGRLSSLPPPPDLPTAVNPAAIGRPEFTHRAGHLDEVRWARFKTHAQAIGVTPSAALCTAYAQVLAAWSRSPRFTLNLLFLNRLPLHPEVNRLVGNFTTTTLLEMENVATEGFHVKAERVQKQLWTDLEHSRVSGVRVLREMSRARPGAGLVTMPVVFASTVNFGAAENPGAARSLAHPLIGMAESGHERWSSVRTPQVWLDHQVLEQDGGVVLNWDTVDAIFPAGMLDEMFAAYLELLHQLCDDEHAWRQPAAIMVQERTLDQRRAANATDGPLPGGLLHERFEDRAAEHPDKVAVIAAGLSVTYGQLHAWSNRIGNLLRSQGIGRGALVAVVMHKGLEQIAAVLGILKAGAAYVPIDAAVPEERLRVLIETAGIGVALTQSSAGSAAARIEGLRVFTVDGSRVRAANARQVEGSGATPEDLAYVIFTSGSTGVPKGVMIDHAAAVNTVCDINERFGVTGDDRVLALSALHFDLSVYDIFGLLGVGGAVVLPEPEAHREPARWLTLVREHRVTVWDSVPMLMEMFAAHLLATGGEPTPLRLVMLSGDWVAVTLPDKIRAVAPQAAIWSLGGATEAAIWSIAYPIDRVDPAWVSIPYGKPLRNQRFHVLDEAMRPCPVWVPGQLYIAGAGLARGYLNDERKTRASFPRHPITGERVYRTGDLGRYLPDGNIEFLGREDFQVKVQGYRIELGEIEAALLKVTGVRAAVATAVGERHESKRLLGYVVADETVSTTGILAALRDLLPDYYVPQQIMALPELPLSANGKLDRSRLPKPEETGGAAGQPMVEPRNDTERFLVEIWSEFFEGRSVGITDSFFDLGGDSLLAVRLMARIENRLGLALPVSTLFSQPTIAGLATLAGDPTVRARREALVPVRPRGSRLPLFFVHPVSGDVLCYSDLASQLGERQPFYALQVPDTDRPLETVPELAAHYVEAIAKVEPTGPYRLGGWSMGGVIALEMARQIGEAGGVVDQLIVVDLLEPPGRKPGTLDDAELLSWLGRDLGGQAGLSWLPSAEQLRSPDQPPLRVLLDLARAAGALPPDLEMRDFEPIARRFVRNSQALLAYEPQPYSGRVHFIRAREGATRSTVKRWLKLLTGDAAVVDVPGGHYSIMRPPHLTVLADELRAVLDTGVAPSTSDTDKEETL